MSPVTELTKRASRILELRAEEMRGLTLRTNDPDRVTSNDALRWKMGIDLRPLWLTAYGYEVLSAMGLGFQCRLAQFERVSEEFKRLGFPIRLVQDGELEYLEHVSPALRQYIWKLVEHAELGFN